MEIYLCPKYIKGVAYILESLSYYVFWIYLGFYLRTYILNNVIYSMIFFEAASACSYEEYFITGL